MESSRPSGPEFEPISPSQEIANMLRGNYGEEFGFDAETVEEIAALPFSEAFEIAYSYLTSAEVDADAALAQWVE